LSISSLSSSSLIEPMSGKVSSSTDSSIRF
jgi:hypothetical protein